ncbi:MAG: TetR/AcrR family transcriptional regulator [Anaerolineae bacterium]|nr:TetR/AcrR family transcriptional regulator [Anaerolineae bacterium]
MNDVKKPLTHRQRQALATQQLIVATARELFVAQGYVATTMEAIAESAGVAVSTVYAIFRNKRGILREIRQTWHRESGQRDIYHDAIQQADPRQRLALAAHATRRQWETGAPMMTIYQGAAAADAEAAAELEEALNGRRKGIGPFIRDMAEANLLRPDLSPDQAVAIFLALTQSAVYQELVDSAGWSPDAYEAWLVEVLSGQLLPADPP